MPGSIPVIDRVVGRRLPHSDDSRCGWHSRVRPYNHHCEITAGGMDGVCYTYAGTAGY